MGIKTTILRLVIAIQFSMLAPKVVYTDFSCQLSARLQCLFGSSGHRPIVEGPGERRHLLPKKK